MQEDINFEAIPAHGDSAKEIVDDQRESSHPAMQDWPQKAQDSQNGTWGKS
jgi:hypothetical protein